MNGELVPDPRIAAIQRARRIAAATLAKAIREEAPKLSELSLCTRWGQLLADHEELLSEGWYQPPPNGISALIGTPPDFKRMSYVSLRHEATWPRADITLGGNSIMYAYCSPVDRETKMIGDLGITLYNGADSRIKDHLAACFDITAQVAAYAEVGMELRELYRFAADLIDKAALANETFSTTDQSGGVDVGHTLPWSFNQPTSEEQQALDSGDLLVIARTISDARHFLNAEEGQRILPTMGFTVEPRMAGPEYPLASFHVLVTFTDGVKRIHADFSELLDLFDMPSYLPRRALETLGCG
ncbi:M24 family metallopeptidase [Nonomuraea sp. K274]|uniref:M24 family metallopeptidase n=1 Tax=Nonomuraea cypriaca TaxID=1187855 RepID=A0A931A315_9ACTN|nr:M24 family metallopeptidase [Nonomuraea cypriaca]MBF8185321.1 M24 family metallopeptidase [Nonomuraea cypriaca]